MSKETIGLDIDDVLFPFAESFLAYHNKTHGTVHHPRDVAGNYAKLLGLDGLEVASRIYAFHGLDDLHIPPIEGAVDAVATLAASHTLVAVTARHPRFADQTTRYLETYFRGSFSGVRLIGHAAVMERPCTKLEVCKELGAVALADDTPGHLEGCAEAGITPILFGDYPWNRSAELADGIVRCKNWNDVQEYFDGISTR